MSDKVGDWPPGDLVWTKQLGAQHSKDSRDVWGHQKGPSPTHRRLPCGQCGVLQVPGNHHHPGSQAEAKHQHREGSVEDVLPAAAEEVSDGVLQGDWLQPAFPPGLTCLQDAPWTPTVAVLINKAGRGPPLTPHIQTLMYILHVICIALILILQTLNFCTFSDNILHIPAQNSTAQCTILPIVNLSLMVLVFCSTL